MTFKLNTHDIQYLVIALIMSSGDTIVGADDEERLINKLTELNKMCVKRNDYTLTVTVEG